MVGPWAYGGFEGQHVDCWLSSRVGWSVDVLRGVTASFQTDLIAHCFLN